MGMCNDPMISFVKKLARRLGFRRKIKYVKGRWSYGSPSILKWPGSGELKIGNFCSLAGDVTILLGGEHRKSWVSTFPFPAYWPDVSVGDPHTVTKGDVIIGSDVWIGQGAKILSGVVIGNGAIIGAYSVVAKNVRPYAIVVGSPAKEIARRFSDEQVDALERMEWWNWDDDTIRARMGDIMSSDVSAFIRTYSSREK
jgi:acetyltransferase-like isoleucine patch superfamily enzyme